MKPLNTRTVMVGFILLSMSSPAFAAVKFEDIVMNFLRLVAFLTSAGIIVTAAYGVWAAISVGFQLRGLSDPNKDPELGRKLGGKAIQSAFCIALSGIVVALIVSLFGGTDFVNFIVDGYNISTDDMLNLNQGQTVSG
jgi:hypothetical protein